MPSTSDAHKRLLAEYKQAQQLWRMEVYKVMKKVVLSSSSSFKNLDSWVPMGGGHDPKMVARFLTAIEGGFIDDLGSGGGTYVIARRRRSTGFWVMKKAGRTGNFAQRKGSYEESSWWDDDRHRFVPVLKATGLGSFQETLDELVTMVLGRLLEAAGGITHRRYASVVQAALGIMCTNKMARPSALLLVFEFALALAIFPELKRKVLGEVFWWHDIDAMATVDEQCFRAEAILDGLSLSSRPPPAGLSVDAFVRGFKFHVPPHATHTDGGHHLASAVKADCRLVVIGSWLPLKHARDNAFHGCAKSQELQSKSVAVSHIAPGHRMVDVQGYAGRALPHSPTGDHLFSKLYDPAELELQRLQLLELVEYLASKPVTVLLDSNAMTIGCAELKAALNSRMNLEHEDPFFEFSIYR